MFVVRVLAIAFLQHFFVEEISGAIGVTLSVFSGIPDPHWVIEPTQEILALYKEAEKAKALVKVNAMPSRLGYRGFIVQEDTTEVLILGPKTAKLQLKLLETIPEYKIPQKVLNRVTAAIKEGKIVPVVQERKKRFEPPYNPVPWISPVKEKNNCYNYANIKPTGTFAQPGKYARRMYTAITKARIQAAAVADGLVVALNSNNPQSRTQHVVALVVDDCVDFHWYIKHPRGIWSHKPGKTAVTRLDNAGRQVVNPETCAKGNYEFVTYMITDTAAVNIL